MLQPAYIPVPRALKARDINGYSEDSHTAKAAFHRAGLKFLRSLAMAIGLPLGSFEVRSNKGGPAVSGEITLHGADLYVQLSESFSHRGVSMLFRTCSSRTDYCGHQNNFASIDAFDDPEQQLDLVQRMRDMVKREQARKARTAAPALI